MAEAAGSGSANTVAAASEVVSSLPVAPMELSSDAFADTTVPSASDTDSHSDDSDRPHGVEIICVGLMRTGLKSLHEALKQLGHGPIYDQDDIGSTFELWNDIIENRRDDRTITNIFQGAKVAMGMPTFCFWEEILQEHPNAKVILTVRDEEEWWESVQRAKAHMDHDLPGAPLKAGSLLRRFERFLMPSYHKFCEVLRFSWSSSLGMLGAHFNRCCVLNNFRKHNHYVQAVLGDRRTPDGNPQLLVYNVRDGWEPLCEFLGQEVPDSDFPSIMHVPYFGQGPTSPSNSTMRLDRGGEFHEILVPDSGFGIKMRSELRRGLICSLGALMAIALPVIMAVQYLHFVSVSPMALTIVFLILSCVSWNVYVVMHSLVMRVPAAVVLPMAMKSLLIAGCLHACYITYGILKEQIVTQDHIASPVLILATRLMSVLCAAVAMFMYEGRMSLNGPPVHHFLAFGFSNELATWAGYAVLNYVSFPVQIMAKSCKMLPSMMMGRFIFKSYYSASQYFQAIGAMICVTIMHLSEAHGDSANNTSAGSDDGNSSLVRSMIGVSLLGVFFVADSFTSQWQQSLYKKHPELTQNQMMFMGNLVGTLITLLSIAGQWSAVSSSLAAAFAHPEIFRRIIYLGLSGALGQFCIYTAIKVLGGLAFNWIMTARQLLSVLISLVLFGHGVSVVKLACIFTVFAIMSSKQLSRAIPTAVQVSVRTASAISRSISTTSITRSISSGSLGGFQTLRRRQ